MSLDVEFLHFAYGRRAVLQGVDASWGTGQVVGLLGPNGAGKSTLVTCLAQLRRYSGTVSFQGRRGRELRGVVGYMPQGLPGDAALTALESVLTASRRGVSWRTSRADIALAWGALDELGVAELADRPLGQLSGGQRQLVALAQTLVRRPGELTASRRGVSWRTSRADSALAWGALSEVRVAELAERPLGQLSGGQRQMVALAQTLVRRPGLIRLDAPTSALDLRRQVSVLSHMRRICHRDADRLAVVALHDLNLAARFCDRLAVLADGRILAEGPPVEVLRPEVIAEVYGLRVRIVPDGEHVMVAPEAEQEQVLAAGRPPAMGMSDHAPRPGADG